MLLWAHRMRSQLAGKPAEIGKLSPRGTDKTRTQAVYAGNKGAHRCRCLAAWVQAQPGAFFRNTPHDRGTKMTKNTVRFPGRTPHDMVTKMTKKPQGDFPTLFVWFLVRQFGAAGCSQITFYRGISPKPLSLLCGGHPLFSLDEKRGEKNQIGRHLDTPSEIILQASLRMHFEGGQGSFFFDAGQWHRLAACFLALLLFSHSGRLRGRKAYS